MEEKEIKFSQIPDPGYSNIRHTSKNIWNKA